MIDSNLVLLAGLASSLFMTGLIWFVDCVHYPLFDRVGASEFARYHEQHSRITSYVVIGPMMIELVASILLVIQRPPGSGRMLVWAGLIACVSTWTATGLLSVPMHQILSSGFDPKAHRRLVRTNRVRVVAWTLHSLILVRMVANAMR